VSAAAWRGLILTIVIAAAAGFIGARLGTQGAAEASSTPAATATGMPQVTVRQSVEGLLRRDFKLTADQRTRLRAIDDRFTRQHNLIWADIRMSNAELAAAVASDMSMNQEAKNAITEIQDSVGRLHTESIQYVLEVRQVLTPEQRAEFDDHIVMALMRDPA
jgi:Spy/CpxP family protein refolding chaperone